MLVRLTSSLSLVKPSAEGPSRTYLCLAVLAAVSACASVVMPAPMLGAACRPLCCGDGEPSVLPASGTNSCQIELDWGEALQQMKAGPTGPTHCGTGAVGEHSPGWVSLQDCIICMEKLSMASGYSDATDSKTFGPVAVGRLAKCSHAFHLLCLLAMYCNGNKVSMAHQGQGWGSGSPSRSLYPSCCT